MFQRNLKLLNLILSFLELHEEQIVIQKEQSGCLDYHFPEIGPHPGGSNAPSRSEHRGLRLINGTEIINSNYV